MSVIIVIPARFGSQRLPGKILADIHGRPMIQWVHEGAMRVPGIDQVLVATDDDRIATAVHKFGGKVVMTSSDLASGTDRVAAVARLNPQTQIFVNVQGDEPLIQPEMIQRPLELVQSGRFAMASAVTPFKISHEISEPSVVKALVANDQSAIYFSRHPIPYSRQPIPEQGPFICMKHLGIYVYRRETLLKLTELPQTDLEKAESLEQLRALANGISIGLATVSGNSIGVDTQSDLDQVRKILTKDKTNEVIRG